jgi:hydrogenase expression/formation protein HypE
LIGDNETILLAHGSGGQLGHDLVEQIFVREFDNRTLAELGDSAIVETSTRIALTTDSYVVSPIFFPGGDIGKLAVCGTVNDLAVVGAQPLYLSAGFIIEEGLPVETLKRVVRSMAHTAREAGVAIVTGDTKVVGRGAADGLFINTAGVGNLPNGLSLGTGGLRSGDRILVSGTLGDHGIAVMMEREGLQLRSSLRSDCAPLNGLIAAVLDRHRDGIRCMRDPTRGGLVSTLNEWADAAGVGIEIDESALPFSQEVEGACEILGLDPLYVANEGKAVIAVASAVADRVLGTLQAHPLGRRAVIIGEITDQHPGHVVLRTALGARRILAMLAGEQLPRIC